jgi:hypothetical protein
MLSSARKCLIVGVVLAASLVTVASAAASTVTVTPSGPKTATTGAIRFAIAGGSGTTTITCTGATITGTLNSARGTYPIAISTNIQLVCAGGRSASLNVSVACSGTAILSVTGDTNASGITPLQLTGINCRVSLTSTPTCNVTITGSVRGQFANATSQLTIFRAGQALTASGSTCTSTFQNGAVGISSATGGDIVFNVTPATTIVATTP